jgi:hypothetical protein
MSAEPEPLTIVEESTPEETCERSTLRVIGWFSAGMALAALGIYLGYELRKGYKFNRRTPYDFFSGAGEPTTSEFGMGV